VPISYLDQLTTLLEADQLSRDEQLRLVADLRDRLGTEEESDALVLFERLRKRPDLLASTARDIDRILASATEKPEVPPPQAPREPETQTPSRVPSSPPLVSAPAAQATSFAATNAGATTGERPNNYMVWAIVSAVLFIFTGIIAVISAAQVNSKYDAGDYSGAKASSDNAKRWVIISLGAFGVLFFLYLMAQAEQAYYF
jgi:hypothetical protein